MKIMIGDVEWSAADVSGLRDNVIQMRDAALKQGAMEWAVVLSNNIALLAKVDGGARG